MMKIKFETPYFMRSDDEIRGYFLQYAERNEQRQYIRQDAPIEVLRDAVMDYEMPKPKTIVYYDYDETGGSVAVIDWFSGQAVESDFISKMDFEAAEVMPSLEAIKHCTAEWARQVRNDFDSVRVEYRPNLQKEFDL